MGGWWALSGFTYQMLVALDKFLKDSLLPTPSPSITVEELSDILVAGADGYRLTQVKRTLTNPALASAVREAYEILNLAEKPLRERLVFQIVCQENLATMVVSGVTGDEVFRGTAYDIDIFAKTLQRFDRSNPVLISAHPAHAILQTLWNAGVENPVAAMSKAIGCIFAAFDGQALERVQRGVFEALDSIMASRRGARVAGRLLAATDFTIHTTSSPHRIPFNSRPRLEDLRLDRFLHRKEYLEALESKATKWLADVPTDLRTFSRKLPVFWIEGRRGDGKSVALLQAAERLLSIKRLASITELRDIDDMRTWLDTRVEVLKYDDELPIDVAFIDDLPTLADPEALDALIAKAFHWGDRAAALLTCGSSDDLKNFEAMSSTAIVTFIIRPPDETELELFRSWLKARTGEPVEKLDLAEKSLATWLFDSIGMGKSHPEVEILRTKLEQEGLFELARIAAALNACGVAAPRSLFSEDEVQRLSMVFASTSEAVALNLEVFTDGIRIGHADAIQSLYKSWSGGETAKLLGPDVGMGLKTMCEEGHDRLARQLLGQLMDRKYLRTRFGIENDALVDFSHAIWERSRGLHLANRASVLPLWLTFGKAKRLSKALLADVRREAVAALKLDAAPERFKAEIAPIIYLTRDIDQAGHSAAKATILRSTDPKVISFLKKCCEKRDDHEVPKIVELWLQRHPNEPLAALPIQALLLSNADEKIVGLSCDFIERNIAEPRTGDVLWSIALGDFRTPRFYPIVDKWLDVAPDPVIAARLFTRQLRGRRGRNYVTRAMTWVRRNMDGKAIHEVLSALVAAAGEDREVIALARQWLLAHPHLSEANPLLTSMVGSEHSWSEGLELALDRLDKGLRDEAWRYLFREVREAVVARPRVEVRKFYQSLQRGPANILEQMLPWILERVEEPRQPVHQKKKRREKYTPKSARR
ncbi:hypothetical protein [Agrobacterium tumefaciens]|uniref:hypothetical protein n=1 Tax=Agrobacterium tumefaciens TaxID=358 RepID=UPI001FA96FCD|nr:hypothetical protein [Agrobacterium tumefaciens]UNZ53829.1 hypothetical protein MLE07_24130 [Agrobacterium tumefaciens]